MSLTQIAPIRHPGNESLFLAVEMSLLATLVGAPLHVHAEGLRGTGKTTVMRWAKQSLPTIDRIAGCLYHCDPSQPHCPMHAQEQKTALGMKPFETEQCPMPFVEIGQGAKLGTVLGSIDLKQLTDAKNPGAALLPGAIPMAHRGILFVDEINRLAETAPEIADVLLSVMGTKPGYVKLEEVGLPPCEIPVQTSVWAASNPDEDPGPLEDIRKQLADRFDLVVPVQRPNNVSIIEKMLAGKSNARNMDGGAASFQGLMANAELFRHVTVPPDLIRYIAQLYVQRNIESLRAVEALELASRLAACLKGKQQVTFDEILTVMPLVLRHRVEPTALSEILKDLELRKAAGNEISQGFDSEDGSVPPKEQVEPDQEKQIPKENTQAASDLSDKASAPNTWFGRILSKYYKKEKDCPNTSGRNTDYSASSNQVQRLQNPALLPPVSPPDAARPISLISVANLITPADTKELR